MLLLVLLLLSTVSVLGAPRMPTEYCHGNPAFVSNAQSGYKLAKVQLMTRHGDRTPLNLLPPELETVDWECDLDFVASDSLVAPAGVPGRALRKSYMPGRQSLKGNCALGELTSKGADQHIQLGKSFNDMYVQTLQFLPQHIDPSIMFLRSTDIPRTVLSAFNFLEGLYPSATNAVPDGLLQLNVVEDPMDNSGGGNALLCPALQGLYDKRQKSSEYIAFYNSTLLPIATKYSKLWNTTINSSTMHKLNDILRSRYCHGMPLPMDQTEAETVMSASSWLSNYVSDDQHILSLSQYSFLREWVDRFNATDSTRFALYSAHDTSIREFLLALHAATLTSHWPPLAGHVALELWLDASGNRFVAMQYDGAVRMMNPPCTGIMCSWNDFVTLVESYRCSPAECKA